MEVKLSNNEIFYLDTSVYNCNLCQ